MTSGVAFYYRKNKADKRELACADPDEVKKGIKKEQGLTLLFGTDPPVQRG